jgi:Na+-driven multidrug efflux pump
MLCAATNMLALSLARRDRPQIGSTLSDAIVISCMMGVVVAVTLYAAAPAVLTQMAGSSAAAIVPPAVEYVRWRCVALR